MGIMKNTHDWIIDREHCTATHESGLVIEFRSAEYGLIDGFPINREAWLSTFPTWEHETVQSLFPTLICQGSQAYCNSLNARN